MATTSGLAGSASTGRDPAPAYLVSFVALGLGLSVAGPALSHLETQAHTTLRGVSLVFPVSAVGYLLGSLAAGRGYDRGLGHRLLAGGLGLMAVSFLLLPLPRSLLTLCIVMGVSGIAGGVVDVGGNTLLVWSRGREVAPLMNALHLCFGIGALCCPLLVALSIDRYGGLGPAAVVMALLAVAAATGVLLTHAPAHPFANAGEDGAAPPRALLAAVSLFFVLYVGVELGFAGWVHTYAEAIDLGGPGAAAGLTATFWAAFTFGRLLAIGVARRVTPRALLIGSCLLAVAAAALLVLGAGSPAAVWGGTALFGLALAPQYPTMIAFAERHLNLTGAATAWFVAASAAGSLVFPWLIGQLFAGAGASALPSAVFVASAATLAWVVVVVRLLRASGARPGADGTAPAPAPQPAS